MVAIYNCVKYVFSIFYIQIYCLNYLERNLIAMSVVKTTIITGYLGAGKTTLINKILHQKHGLRIAVIVNEFGELGIDGDLILNTNEEIIELTNGCLCCSVRGDLLSALASLQPRLKELDGVIIETSGLADPAPVAQTFLIGEDQSENFELDAVITLVDARNGNSILTLEPEAISQVAFADRLILTKTDLVSDVAISELRGILSSLNPSAQIFSASFGEVDLEAIMNIGAFDIDRLEVSPLAMTMDHEHSEDVKSLAFTSNQPIDPDRFMQWMQQVIIFDGTRILRSKGVLDFAGETRRFVFQGVQTVLDGDVQGAWPEGARESRLILIGRDLNEIALRKGWENCFASSLTSKTVPSNDGRRSS
jgi:G3E family GTPase